MGDVYQATDLKLGRSVAVKFLPEAFARDGERVARFEREARVLASLNHPNIAAIHGMEEAGGKKFLVMELVDGETLADRIRRGPIPIEEALAIARQITESLEAAHASGIVHRDLKPANIKVRDDGTVKVLDFGLAKAIDEPKGSSLQGLENSPTITSPAMTMHGVILGTASYMSPEQARGKAVDKRTDIFAFGCVLFEMLAGRRAFDGEDVADTLSRVIQRDPAWDLLPATVPPRIVDVLRLCLEKNLRTRRSDIADVRIDLDLAMNAKPMTVAASSRGRASAGWIAAGIAALLAGVMAVPAWRYLSVEPSVPGPPALFLASAPTGVELQPMVSVSPDGSMVAFIGGNPRRVWIRRLQTADAVALEGTGGISTVDVFWSPDSRHLAFRDRNGAQLKAVDISTGVVRVICDLQPSPFVGGAWGQDGTILLGGVSGLSRVPASGGTPVPLTMKDGASQAPRGGPQFLPDGRHFLYALGKATNPSGYLQAVIHVGDLASLDATPLIEADSYALAASGFLLFARGRTLFAQPFSPDSFQVSGTAVPIQRVVPDRPSFSLSQNGVLAVRSEDARDSTSDLMWTDRAGRALGTLTKPPTGDYANPAISPDGNRVAVNSLDPRNGKHDIWVIDLSRDVAERFTFGDESSVDPLWSPDGRQIAFLAERDGRLHIVAKATDGSGEQTLEDLGPGIVSLQGGSTLALSDWSPDGKFIVYAAGPSAVDRSLRILSVGDRTSRPLVIEADQPYSLQFSRDGRWIAYTARDAGRFEVFIRSFPALTHLHQISNGGGTHPRWGRNDGEIFYTNNGVNVVSLTASGGDKLPGAPRVAYSEGLRSPLDGRPHYDLSPDGQRLLVRKPTGVGDLSSVKVLVNWPAMLPQ
jgi:eukaryotic-like serine/threonine-protein kinase